ncbi:L-threonine dehydrogenase [Marinospirillum sp. MEB164]|uniref:L-threonine dehydrogenase n=1 Tax=Marinospirillum alkalitolerans TaxID=3123374 RepID=A0ABW8PVV9_9GAMM
MSVTEFHIPPVNLMGQGALAQTVELIQKRGYKKALLVTDTGLMATPNAQKLVQDFKDAGLAITLFDQVKPNPTSANVEAGLALLQQNDCDLVISLGGGSPHDCAKGIALVATNGGRIHDYEGVNQSQQPQLPLIAINTTAGTASEMTRFCIITDEARHIKMAIVDQHVTPILSVNDPEIMAGMPSHLTAATGMDALTHAVEAYVSTAATPITDACALKAISLIAQYLPTAVEQGQDMQAREQMAYAQFLAGMAFNNASLGYVHAMAHQLGGFYDLPHGVCNAVLLPAVQKFNAQVAGERLADIALALGASEATAEAAIQAIEALKNQVKIPRGLKELGAQEKDIPLLAENALKDACGFTNPIQATQEQIEQIFRDAW